jgi:hypothetical protein
MSSHKGSIPGHLPEKSAQNRQRYGTAQMNRSVFPAGLAKCAHYGQSALRVVVRVFTSRLGLKECLPPTRLVRKHSDGRADAPYQRRSRALEEGLRSFR